MQLETKIKMFKDVFAPKSGEKVLFLVDVPHDNIKDTKLWKDRRDMAQDWFQTFKELGEKIGFSVEMMEFKASGIHNAPIPNNVINVIKKSNLAIAMTEYSATSSLLPISKLKGTITRCASMPMIEKRMEKTAISADYKEVQKYAASLQKLLNKTIGADVIFSTDDTLHVDLRNRIAHMEAGDCTKTGQFINFPSGESYKAPYEGVPDEISQFGRSKTEGILPAIENKELMRYNVKNNTIVEVVGNGKRSEEMRKFFEENDTHRNIAEFAIGCNKKAVITGNILEDEKTSGLHIAYGMSTHLGGKIESDMHIDIVYSKGCPVEATTVTLIFEDGKKLEIIQNAELRYELLE